MALVLNKFEDMNYAEIAEVMGLTTTAVKSLLARAREHLRTALSSYVDTHSEPSPRAPGVDEEQ
jgi:RNA polymerase sigma-70 factor (ECF subfamily)